MQFIEGLSCMSRKKDYEAILPTEPAAPQEEDVPTLLNTLDALTLLEDSDVEEGKETNGPSLGKKAAVATIPSDRWARELQGYLQKQGSTYGKLWKTKYFVLQGGNLFYYHSKAIFESGGRPRGFIPLSSIEFDVTEAAEGSLGLGCCGPRILQNGTFVIRTRLREYNLHADNEEAKRLWINALLQLRTGRGKLGSSQPSQHAIAYSKLREEARTGDLLLFRTNTKAATLQRTITHARHDHVALVLEDDAGLLHIFESIGGEGVSTIDFDTFVFSGYHSIYEQLALRRLNPPATTEQRTALYDFADSVMGKQYKINPKKLLRSHAKAGDEHSGYFCSELVACAYQAMGLLPPNPPSSKYWPGSFSMERNLTLLGGTQLDNELAINFEDARRR